MSNMTTKPDFAQKLLNDLRQRKERMAATQHSSRQSSQTSRVARGTSRGGARQMNALDSARSTTRGSRSVNTKDASSHIIVYEGRQSSKQVRDLSMAIAFAFENSGNLSSISGSSSNPLVNFFNRFGRRSSNSRKMEATGFYNHTSAGSFPNIHVNEISKGVHKLNQILSACSNGLNLDRNSIEIGRELLKGAIDLEESLRMLVSLQDASEYTNSSQRKGRIKLLGEDGDEDEDEDDDNGKRVVQWELDRPRFSFDRASGKSRVVQGGTRQQPLALPYRQTSEQSIITHSQLLPHTRSNSYVEDYSVVSLSKPTPEKGRISNVIAKLMGLEEAPLKEGSVGGKNVSNESAKQKKSMTRETRNNGSDLSTNKLLPRRDPKQQIKPEKSHETKDGASKMVNSERSQLRKDFKMQAVSIEPANIMIKKQQSQTNHVDGVTSFKDNTRKPTHGEDKRALKSTMLKAEGKTSNRIEQVVSANSVEKRNANNYVPKNQEQVTKRPDRAEDKNSVEYKPQQLQKHNLVAKIHEGQQVEHINASKSKRSAATNQQKKLPCEKSTPGDGRSTKVPVRDSVHRRHQDADLTIDNSQNTAINQENPQTQRQSQDLSKTESGIEEGSSRLLAEEKPAEASATQKRTVSRKVQRREIPEKIEVLATRRNSIGTAKRPDNILRGLKQQIQNKSRASQKTEEPSDRKVKQEEKVINASKIVAEPVKLDVKIETGDDQAIVLNSTAANESQIDKRQNKLKLNNSVVDDLEEEEQPRTLKVEEEQTKSTERDLLQHEQSNRQEQLTEQEKHLKETVIKSQMFLSTAEALFKLNIPLSFLHAADHENEVSGKKLVLLDSANEVIRRKARRHESMYNPYMKTGMSNVKIRSLDDLVRQLCKNLELLKCYGMSGSDECDVAAGLHRMLSKDIYNEDPDVNCMWDFEWSRMMSIFPEMETVVKDVERQMLNGLLDEIASDILLGI
ncbi:uncharacterized protein LOC121781535 [Salvia splendens]|uniref:uncharacterized protein LOC121781535 n=1 Tax=Salvia splendens TaxID=180675 RepID=UPI001C266ED4|nr:uncharacterized protein LOC121781535 [Salvia splendens]